jgi:hypothetical protein
MKTTAKVAAIIAVLALGGCINMSTPPAEITATPVSAQKYENHTCAQLIDELGTIAKRERTLVEAQDRRVKASNVQALVINVGQGDGAAAADLAQVRGEREAVRNTMIAKQCGK